MNKYLLITMLLISINAFSQNNTFPSSGNVGIGTTTPVNKLEVASGSVGFTTTDFVYNSTGSILQFTHGASTGNTYSEIKALSSGWNTWNNLVLQSGGGNVGIGTTGPRTPLDVRFTGTNNTYVPTINVANSSGAMGGSIGQRNISADARQGLKIFSSGGNLTLNGSNTSTNPAIQFQTGIPSSENTDANTVMTILGNGNVGIGITNPGARLDVQGGRTFVAGLDATAGNSIRLISTTGDDTYANTGYLQIGNAAYNEAGLQINSAGGLGFWNDGTGAWTQRMVIQQNGNVGIGTTSPSEKLSVNGNIRSKKLIVTQTGWSDYVFNDDYKLEPLTEVEQFIKTNKHLPDMPSAKQVEKDGIDVGDNQALLLKKIEELTLYMIEIKKQNEKLEVTVSEQNKRITQLEKEKKK